MSDKTAFTLQSEDDRCPDNYAINLDQEISVFHIEGPDATRYLHARTTQDVTKIKPLEHKKAMLLSAQGKVFGLFSILRIDDTSFYLLTHGKDDEQFLEELQRFKVADRFDCKKITFERALLLSQMPLPLANSQIDASNFHLSEKKDFFILPIQLGKEDFFIFVSLQKESTEEIAKDYSLLAVESFHALRIDSFLPWMQHDITAKTSATEIPHKEYISFTKGCYTGQEVVEMSTARGRPNYKLVKVTGQQNDAPKFGDKLIDKATQKDIGFVTRGVFNAKQREFTSLAFIKSATKDSSAVTLNEKLTNIEDAVE